MLSLLICPFRISIRKKTLVIQRQQSHEILPHFFYCHTHLSCDKKIHKFHKLIEGMEEAFSYRKYVVKIEIILDEGLFVVLL